MATETDRLLIEFQADASKALAPLKKLEQQTKLTQQAFKSVGNNSKRLSNQFQNVGFQVQDFAVQVSGGTDAMRAFSQQGPQLLSVLGPIGVAAGTAVAVFAPFAKELFNTADAAEEAVDSLDKFKSKLAAIGASNSGPIAELTTALGKADAVTRAWILSLLELEKIKLGEGLASAQKEVDKYVASLTKYTEVIGVSIDGIAIGVGKLTGDAAKLEGIKENLGVDKETAQSVLGLINAYDGTAEAAKILAAELNNLAAAGKIDPEVLSGFDDLVDKLDNVAGSVGSLSKLDSKALSEPLDKLAESGKAAYEAMLPLGDYFKELEAYADAVARRQDPTISMVEQITLAKDAYDRGLLSLKQYNKELENIAGLKKRSTALQESLDLFDKEILGLGKDDGIKTLLEELQTEAGKWADQFANTLVSGLAEGKLAFKDFADYVLQQLARIAISKALEPLFNSFSELFPTSAETGIPTARGLIATPADMPMARLGDVAQPMIVGVPRAAGVSTGSKGAVAVTVNNYGNDEVEINERQTTRGLEVEVLINKTVKNAIGRGEYDRVMANSFGTRRLAF